MIARTSRQLKDKISNLSGNDSKKAQALIRRYMMERFLARILYAGQKATVRTGHGTKDWFQIGKGVCQGCILSPCLFNLCRVHHEKR